MKGKKSRNINDLNIIFNRRFTLMPFINSHLLKARVIAYKAIH